MDSNAVNFLGQSEISVTPDLVEQVATHRKQNLTDYTNFHQSLLATATDISINEKDVFLKTRRFAGSWNLEILSVSDKVVFFG